ncbi:nacrein-like protein [Ostrea edulis]|uniref:nacrein-like protein n=1 Tax=Ostrea edulis TaxID=37623 RepID=UPI0024AF4A9D|nr:nacrein-like protein [Ostrea edulis]
MAHFGLLVVVVLCFVGIVSGAGYEGKRPQSQGACYYDDINKAHFSYERDNCEGPKNWCRINRCWTTCGSDRRQSPINIDTYRTMRRYFKNLELKNLYSRVPAETFNNGHSPHFEVKEDELSEDDNIILTNVPGRPNYKSYVFAQLHMHVGREDDKGSEHSINDRFYPMEAHMVFYDDEYSDLTHAMSSPDGLVVIGVMLEVNGRSDDSSECTQHGECKVRFAKRLSHLMEKYYKKIKEHKPENPGNSTDTRPRDLQCGKTPSQEAISRHCVKKATHHDDMVSVECGISPADVLPRDQRFYTYAGSLTTPPCYETVQWIVFKCPVRVSKKALKRLQEVEDSHKDPLKKIGVRRPIQKNRYVEVYRNF